ncbi:Protein of unknown function [Modicisalibacter ilicicola DSM 19980]|uniref:DUF2782 domain-containing protein n=1 Tax=Modicisalibacter ilicicola DSM 19980 TaxID=1121942 RepID=A0A1M5EFF8_9GAMM|nr:DUF2782 domain-containing protein [Halomonas ilicicola]SHF77874.1 Protein of unknown function [Halomonas ilicicola DSM 19980]
MAPFRKAPSREVLPSLPLPRLVAGLFIAVALLLSSPMTLAQEQPTPDITVRQEEDRTIREYRINGQLYAIEIEPAVGPSYFLIDDDGDGDFRRSDNERIAIPSWVLFSW